MKSMIKRMESMRTKVKTVKPFYTNVLFVSSQASMMELLMRTVNDFELKDVDYF